MIQTLLLFKCKLLCYHANQKLVSIITRSPSASLQIRGLATKYTTAKWPIVSKQFSVLDRKAVAVQEMSMHPYPEILMTVRNLAPRIWCETCEPVVSNNTQLHFKRSLGLQRNVSSLTGWQEKHGYFVLDLMTFEADRLFTRTSFPCPSELDARCGSYPCNSTAVLINLAKGKVQTE